ncbi:unnamed protein product [Callosobruchus maculatus]|uniref:Uncharacterized protein n=3 Tax=Callosobruchus maculatus TaxID=64391 RepID=A0A653CJN4_CALMS|nr:unnamed protein product [Callosobruchus maculatus]
MALQEAKHIWLVFRGHKSVCHLR